MVRIAYSIMNRTNDDSLYIRSSSTAFMLSRLLLSRYKINKNGFPQRMFLPLFLIFISFQRKGTHFIVVERFAKPNMCGFMASLSAAGMSTTPLKRAQERLAGIIWKGFVLFCVSLLTRGLTRCVFAPV